MVLPPGQQVRQNAMGAWPLLSMPGFFCEGQAQSAT